MFAAKKRHKSVAGSPQEKCELNLPEGACSARFFLFARKLRNWFGMRHLFYEKLQDGYIKTQEDQIIKIKNYAEPSFQY